MVGCEQNMKREIPYNLDKMSLRTMSRYCRTEDKRTGKIFKISRHVQINVCHLQNLLMCGIYGRTVCTISPVFFLFTIVEGNGTLKGEEARVEYSGSLLRKEPVVIRNQYLSLLKKMQECLQ